MSFPVEADYVVSRILGMPFLEEHRCQMNFGDATLHLANQDLACNDHYGRRLRSHIQLVNQQLIPPQSEK